TDDGNWIADACAFEVPGCRGLRRPPHVRVLRQPHRPGGPHMPRDERPSGSRPTLTPSDGAALTLLRDGELQIVGLLPRASNSTYLAKVRSGGDEALAVYKPRDGEAPLWAFPPGTPCRREVAAYVVARSLGWPNVPPP